MLKIGCHLSNAKGFLAMGQDMLASGANTCQFFTRNPRGGNAKALNLKDITSFCALAQKERFYTLIAHAPYTLNPCSKDAHLREFATRIFAEDLANIAHLPAVYYNFHPGSHVGQGIETGIDYICAMLNQVLSKDTKNLVLLETMSGKGSEVGGKFEELRAIIDQLKLPEKVGVCLDTCHVFDAGYDIVHHLEEVLEEFDRIIGLERLKAIHLNDDLNPLGSHKDRHAKIGQGQIGLPALVQIMNHPLLRELPFILETPNDLAGHTAEIALLKGHFHEETC